MIDGLFRQPVNTLMDKWAQRVLQGGLSANKLTLFAFALGLTGCFAAAMQVYPLALLLILINRFLDGLAGAVARRSDVTALGSYLDLLCDFVVFGAFVFLFTLGERGTSLAAAFLLFSYMAMMVAYLAQTTFMTRENPLQTPRGGLVENGEMIVFMVACCLYPPGFAAFAVLFGLMCFTTTVLRVAAAVRTLKS
jgi:phosphatidylserine synthase